MKVPLNPYVGPSPLTARDKLYGRDRELAALMDLLVSERIVLLYSPSGAGKSSLLQAGLIPAMQARGFNDARIIRVNAAPPAGFEGNRYSASVMASLKLPGERGTASLAQYLDPNPRGELLVFDQFEEVVNVDPFNVKARERFFDDLGDVLRAKGRWAIFAMREDYLARLDPYRHRIPTRFSNTFRLDLLSVDSSIDAIRRPALESQPPVAFSLDAARKLAGNLSGVDVDSDPEGLIGHFVEPVQLQVVCQGLWERLPEGTTAILPAQIAQVARIDQALSAYYARSVGEASQQTGVAERAIREWFGEQLINQQGFRAQVLKGVGLDEAVVDHLEHAHVIRSDSRLGHTWVELAHDRLVKPVRADNAAWFEATLTALQKRAELWDQQQRNPGLLVGEAEEDTLAEWREHERPAAGSIEAQYLDASLALQARRLKELRDARLLKHVRWALAVSLVAAVGLAAWAWNAKERATDAEDVAVAALHDADASSIVAELATSRVDLMVKTLSRDKKSGNAECDPAEFGHLCELLAKQLERAEKDVDVATKRIAAAQQQVRKAAADAKSRGDLTNAQLLESYVPPHLDVALADKQIDPDKFIQQYPAYFDLDELDKDDATKQSLRQVIGFINRDSGLQDLRWAAYIMATIREESEWSWAPVEETGESPSYFRRFEVGSTARNLGNTKKGDGYRFRGRGYVLVSGRGNYQRFGRELGVGTQLVDQPDLLTERPDLAYRLVSTAMARGLFTGKKLADYLTGDKADYVNARRIINGGEEAEDVASDAAEFERLLYLSLVPRG